MDDQQWFDNIREQLIREHLPQGYVERFTGELRDHLEDSGASGAEGDASTCLGQWRQVAETTFTSEGPGPTCDRVVVHASQSRPSPAEIRFGRDRLSPGGGESLTSHRFGSSNTPMGRAAVSVERMAGHGIKQPRSIDR